MSWLKERYDETSEKDCESASANARAFGLIAHESENLLQVAESKVLVTGLFASRLDDGLHDEMFTLAFSKFLTCSVCST